MFLLAVILSLLVLIAGVVLVVIKGTRKLGVGFLIGGGSLLVLSLIIGVVAFFMSPDIEGYKADAASYTFVQFADGEVSGSSKVKLTGEVDSSGEIKLNDTFVLADKDGLYYILNDIENKVSFKKGDVITVYGVYVGDDSTTGFPKIQAKVIEKDFER